MSTSEEHSGWNPGYTISSILLQVQNFLSDPDLPKERLPNKEKIDYKDYDKYVNPQLAEYLSRNKQDIHNTVFTFKDFYDYSVAHVTHGGLSISEVTNNLESKKNPDVFFIGEILDVDGICGGYNMMWAFASAYKVARSI